MLMCICGGVGEVGILAALFSGIAFSIRWLYKKILK